MTTPMPKPVYTKRRRGYATVVVLLGLATTTGCAASPPPDPVPATSEPAGAPNLAICEELLMQDPPFETATEVFTAYATDRDTVDQQAVEGAIDYLEDFGKGAQGDVEEGLAAMTDVLRDIRDRYVSGSETEPAVDYQAFQDGMNQVIDGCESL